MHDPCHFGVVGGVHYLLGAAGMVKVEGARSFDLYD